MMSRDNDDLDDDDDEEEEEEEEKEELEGGRGGRRAKICGSEYDFSYFCFIKLMIIGGEFLDLLLPK